MNDQPARHPYPTSAKAPAGPSAAPRRDGSGGLRPPTIVIADDETHIRLVVGEKFRSEGFAVIEARDGEEALELVNSHLPDVVVTDLQMPYMNGIELCSRMAADPRTAHIPGLLLTARGHIIDNTHLSKTVIRKSMAKPFSVKALFEMVQSIVGEAGGEKAGAAVAASATFRRPALPPLPPLTGEAA